MGKLAEIKDMEEAVENGSQEAKEFIAFTKRQAEHNALVEKLLKIVAGCAIGVVAVAAVSALILVPRVSALVSDANESPHRPRRCCRRPHRRSRTRSR